MQLGLSFDSVKATEAGVDEAGRGPLCGSVMAAAVILNPNKPILGLTDSKKLTESNREFLFKRICHDSISWSVASASSEEIDELNILGATFLAMQRAVSGLSVTPELILVDGNRCPKFAIPATAIVKGDAKIASIAAASILAKVTRDKEMLALDAIYPEYRLAKHKGYPTAEHLSLLKKYGPLPFYRKSFRPVRELI